MTYLHTVRLKEQAMQKAGLGECVPCTEEEVKALERWVKHPFPQAYREFLLWMGHWGGGLFRGEDCFFEHLKDIQIWTAELLQEDRSPEPFPEDAFTIFMHQGYHFYFFRFSEGEDPPIYSYLENAEAPEQSEMIRKYDHFSFFLADMIDKAIEGLYIAAESALEPPGPRSQNWEEIHDAARKKVRQGAALPQRPEVIERPRPPMTPARPLLILSIPGLWASKAELAATIGHLTDGLVLQERSLFDKKKNKGFTVNIYEHDPGLQKVFAQEGRGHIPQQELDTLARHTYLLSISSAGGTLHAVEELMDIAAQLLKAGGLAVRVATAEVVHSAQTWLQFASSGSPSLYQAYTALNHKKGWYYTCGMQSLGLRDAQVFEKVGLPEAQRLLQAFLTFTIVEQPVLVEGQTFRVEAQSPLYCLTYQEDARHSSRDLLYNPWGVWCLTPVE